MNAKRIFLPIGLGIGALLVAIAAIIWQLRQFETRLFAINAQTGSVEWSAALPKPIDTVPQIATGNQRVIIDMKRAGDGQNPPSRQLIAFDAASGQQQWAATYDEAAFGEIPIVLTDGIYSQLYDENDTLVALNAADGTLRWAQTPIAVVDWYPIIQQAGDHLVVLFYEDGEHILSLLDAQTGVRIKDIWWSGADESLPLGYNPYLLASDQSIILSTEKAIYAFDAQTGAQRYKLDGYPRRIWLVGTNLYAGSVDQIQAFDALTGDERWVYRLDAEAVLHNSILTTLRADAETIYVFCSYRINAEADKEGWLFALDAQTGSERWAKFISNAGDAWEILWIQAASSTPEMVFVARNLKEIVALSAADGTERWYFRASVGASPQPATDGERVFVIRQDTRWRNWLAQFDFARR